ncbi:MAG TPA: hypothetical protein VE573_19875, partial [Nitrososphaeraceae archaeon]|nr:hypothetical protein [Nitrososphaeraceae archaeon]
MKLHSFDPNTSFRFRTLNELNVLSTTLNESKSKLSTSLQYYLQKYRQVLDIPRLCRALAIPGELAENFIKADRLEQQYTAKDELDQVQYLPIINQIVQTLQRYLYLLNSNQGNNNSKNDLIVSKLSNNQKEAIYTDINELAVYSQMYYDIETVKSDPLIADEYPHGNPFVHIIDIMSQGAIIIRFKYVSRNKSLLSPEEKVVSYHLMEFENKKVLGVHVEGEKKFSMYKQWGEGDERLLPIYPQYANTIIRWGKEEVEEAIINKNKKDYAKEFLY